MTEVVFVLNAYNEERRIGSILRYYKEFGEVVLVDNFSSDATIAIASSLGVKYYCKKNDGTVQTTDWIYWLKETIGSRPYVSLSCSEYLSPDTIRAIQSQLLMPGVGVVELEMKSFTDGIELPLWGKHKRYVERGLHLGRIDIAAVRIHAPFIVSDTSKYKTVRLESDYYVEHLRVTHFASELIKVTNYARIEAMQIEVTKPLVKLGKSVLREFLNFLILRNFLYMSISLPHLYLRCIMHYVIYRELTEVRSDVEKKYETRFTE